MKLEHLAVNVVLMRPRDNSATPFDVIEEARWLAHKIGEGAHIVFTLNGVRITISDKSSIGDMIRDFHRAKADLIVPDIGPSPKRKLSDNELDNDNTIKQACAKLVDLDAREMEAKDRGRWKGLRFLYERKREPLSLASLVFAERWARLIQLNMDNYKQEGSSIREAYTRSAKEAGLPTLDSKNGRYILSDAAWLLSIEWRFGDLVRELVDDFQMIDDLLRQIQSQQTVALPFCSQPSIYEP